MPHPSTNQRGSSVRRTRSASTYIKPRLADTLQTPSVRIAGAQRESEWICRELEWIRTGGHGDGGVVGEHLARGDAERRADALATRQQRVAHGLRTRSDIRDI
eukprot:5289801-Pyramimonas_sp.AAC.1